MKSFFNKTLFKTSDNDCNVTCTGNSSFSCGGNWVMDVHQNSAHHDSGLVYLGCFMNTFSELDRLLIRGLFGNFRNNTPEW